MIYDIDFDEDEPEEEAPRPKKDRRKFSVLYEDDRIIVFDKTPGIATIPERYPGVESLKELAEPKHGRLWTVHRIDKDTSGVVIFARDAEAHKSLNDQFESRQTRKIYAAVVEGEMSAAEMPIDIPLISDPAHPGRMKPSAKGKESVTILRLREQFRGFSYIEAEPLTGRQHQIRVHCKAVGLPLAVDPFYGNHEQLMLSDFKKKYRDYGRDEQPLMDRLSLHAEELTVIHPGTGESISVRAELPRDMRALLTQLRKARRIKAEG